MFFSKVTVYSAAVCKIPHQMWKKKVIEFYPYSTALAPQMKRNKSNSAARNYDHRKLPEIC